MALIKYSLTLVAKQDAPFNVLPNTDVTIRRVSDNGLVLIYSDSDGLIPIAQPGAKTNPRGVFEFYTDSLPVVKAVWSDGGNTYEEVFNGNSLQALSGLTEPSDLDGFYRREILVADFESGGFSAGARLSFTDRDYAPFDVKAAGWPEVANGFDVIADPFGNVAVYAGSYTDINVVHIGVDSSGVTDVRPALTRVHSIIPSDGAKITFPVGDYLLDATGESPTIYNPVRGMLITKNNVKIFAHGARFSMIGISKAYLTSIDDKGSSGRDVFTFFTFLRQSGGEFNGGHAVGEMAGTDGLRYQSPRAKFIGVIGGAGCKIDGLKAENILGNGVNGTPSDGEIDGAYQPLYGVHSSNCILNGCWEAGCNYMGNTFDCSFTDSECSDGGNGFESASTGLRVSNLTLSRNRGSNISISSGDFNVSNITIDGEGSGTDATTGHGFVISSSPSALAQNGVVSGVKVRKITGISLFVYPSAGDIKFNDFKIKDGNEAADPNHSDIYIVGTASQRCPDITLSDFRVDSASKYNITANYTDNLEVTDCRLRGALTYGLLDNGQNTGLIAKDIITDTNLITNSPDSYLSNNITSNSVREFYQFIAIGSIPSRAGRVWRAGDRVYNTTTFPGYDWGFVCKTSGADGVAAFSSLGVVS